MEIHEILGQKHTTQILDVFDYIMGHTNCNPWDWDVKAVPSE